MIRSITLISLRPGTDEATRERVRQAFLELPRHIPQLRSMTVEVDLGLLEGTATLAVMPTFDSAEDFRAYSTHPAHGEVIFPVCGPVMSAYATLQHEA